MAIKTQLFTKELISTDTPLVIDSDCGYTIFSLKGGAGCIATIEGTGKMCGISSQAIPLIDSEVITIGNKQGFGDFTITITAGTVKILAQQ